MTGLEIIQFQKWLIEKLGTEDLDWLLANHTPSAIALVIAELTTEWQTSEGVTAES